MQSQFYRWHFGGLFIICILHLTQHFGSEPSLWSASSAHLLWHPGPGTASKHGCLQCAGIRFDCCTSQCVSFARKPSGFTNKFPDMCKSSGYQYTGKQAGTVLPTVHIDSECIGRNSRLFMVAIRRDISMARTNIISNVAFVGIGVLFLCSHVQRLGYVAAVWRGNSLDANYH